RLCKQYDVDRSQVKIINVEAMPSILPMFDKELVAYAKESLENRGVEFRLDAPIKECTPDSFIIVEDNEEIKARIIMWTDCVTDSPVLAESGFEITKSKLTVDGDMRTSGENNIFILGDCARVIDEEEGKPSPPTSRAAIQHADTCANKIVALIKGGPL